MKYLTAVLNESEIQNYISENEDSAFEYLKNNFKIEDIYESIISNINNFISPDIDLKTSYESIKEYSRNYILNLFNESLIDDIWNGKHIFDELYSTINSQGFDILHKDVNQVRNNFQSTLDGLISSGDLDGAKKLVKNLAHSVTSHGSPLSSIRNEKLAEELVNVFDSKFSHMFKSVGKTVAASVANNVSAPHTRAGFVMAAGAAIAGGTAYFWDNISSLWKNPEQVIESTEKAAPEVKTSALEALKVAENGTSRDMVELVKNSSTTSGVDLGKVTLLPLAKIESIGNSTVKAISDTVPQKEASRIMEIWDNAKEMSVDPRYYVPMLCLVLIGIIYKFKFKKGV